VKFGYSRIPALAAGVVFIFAAVALIFSRVIPGPHRPVDYLVIGTAATFVALLTLFVLLVKTSPAALRAFYRRNKPKQQVQPKDQDTIRTSTSA
jgi:hypothetical protein